MKINYSLPVLLLLASFAFPAMVQARTYERGFGPETYGGTPEIYGGREVAAPPWSFACVNDQGPQQCDEPMWVYGTPRELSHYKDAF